MKKYLIWDFDGTLGYRVGGWTGALLDILRQEAPLCEVTAEQLRLHLQTGFPWHAPDQPHTAVTSADQWWNALDPIFERAYRAVGISVQRACQITKQVRHFYPHPDAWRLFEDTIPALAWLSAQGWTHVILSNHVPELRSIIRHLQLGEYISRIFNSAKTGYEKPHPQAFRNVLDSLDRRAAVWMIGDSIKADVTGAALVGIPSILVRTHHPDVQYCCSELSQVLAIINAACEGLSPKNMRAQPVIAGAIRFLETRASQRWWGLRSCDRFDLG
jgi:putative hydrolase of the HAD superfamily